MNMKLILNRTGLVLKQASPEILTGGGIILGIAALITACSKMKKADAANEEIHAELENEAEYYEENKDRKEHVLACIKIGGKAVWRYLKIFWIPILLELLSIGAIWYSHGIMVKRNADMASAAVILTQQLDKYRARVREKVGEQAENELFYGITNRKIGEVTETLENGKTKKHPIYEKVITDGAEGPFDFVIDREHPLFKTNPGSLFTMIKIIQRSCDETMRGRATKHSKGYYLMSEVLPALNMEPTASSFHWGWWYDANDPKHQDIINFGVIDDSNCIIKDYIDGKANAIPLHFNCHPIDVTRDLGLLP